MSVLYSSGVINIPNVTGNIVITATATAAPVASISAVYTQSGTVYNTDSLDSLKDDLVVTASYEGGTSGVVDAEDYTLSGTLTVGTSTVTVSYSGKTATFNVTVTKDANGLVDGEYHNSANNCFATVSNNKITFGSLGTDYGLFVIPFKKSFVIHPNDVLKYETERSSSVTSYVNKTCGFDIATEYRGNGGIGWSYTYPFGSNVVSNAEITNSKTADATVGWLKIQTPSRSGDSDIWNGAEFEITVYINDEDIF